MVREFTPAGEIVELTIKQTIEPLEDQDIRWILDHIAGLPLPLPAPRVVQPIEPAAERPNLSWSISLFVVIVLLLIVLFRNLPL